jgi:hypothetical protein
MGEYGVSKIFAQEKNITTYNLARMNMLLHGVKDNEFNISLNEPEPQAKSNTLSNFFFLPILGSWLSNETIRERMVETCCGV